MSRCKICGAYIGRQPFGFTIPDKNSHIKNTHPDFVKWHHRYVRTVWFWGFITIGIIAIADLVWLELHGPAPYGLPYSTLIIVAYGFIMLRDFSRKVEGFAQEWRKAHSPLPEG